MSKYTANDNSLVLIRYNPTCVVETSEKTAFTLSVHMIRD